jgi:hypothetical protein
MKTKGRCLVEEELAEEVRAVCMSRLGLAYFETLELQARSWSRAGG